MVNIGTLWPSSTASSRLPPRGGCQPGRLRQLTSRFCWFGWRSHLGRSRREWTAPPARRAPVHPEWYGPGRVSVRFCACGLHRIDPVRPGYIKHNTFRTECGMNSLSRDVAVQPSKRKEDFGLYETGDHTCSSSVVCLALGAWVRRWRVWETPAASSKNGPDRVIRKTDEQPKRAPATGRQIVKHIQFECHRPSLWNSLPPDPD